MKLKRVLYVVPLLVVSLCFAVVAVRFKDKQQRAQATGELVRLCKSEYDVFDDLQRVDMLLRAGADPNAQTPRGDWLLFKVNTPLIPKLVTAGANINARDTAGATPLMDSVYWYGFQDSNMSESTERSRILLKYGADPNLRSQDGDTALLIAMGQCNREASWWNTETARMLLDRGARVDDCDRDGNTSLCKAAVLVGGGRNYSNDGVELVRSLLACGADPQHRNDKGETPLLLMRQQLTNDPHFKDYDRNVRHAITMLQNAIKQRKRVKSPPA